MRHAHCADHKGLEVPENPSINHPVVGRFAAKSAAIPAMKRDSPSRKMQRKYAKVPHDDRKLFLQLRSWAGIACPARFAGLNRNSAAVFAKARWLAEVKSQAAPLIR
jgi:hypothetical protein